MVGTVLVTGATGSLGSALVRKLAGKDLRVLVRSEEEFHLRFGEEMEVDIYEGDLAEQKDIDEAIDDVDTVFHCAGCTYLEWGDLIGHTRRLVQAAEEEVKVVDIVFPGTIHLYGDVGPGPVTEDQEHKGGTKKGDIGLNLERTLLAAHGNGECRVAIARFPDLFGPWVLNRFQERIFPNVLEGKTVTWPGDLDAKRQFIYIDDATEAMARLADSKEGWGRSFNVPGPRATTAREFITMAFEAADEEPSIRSEGRAALKLSRGKAKKEELDLFYLFERPPLLDGTVWTETFGPPSPIDLEEGVKKTVAWWDWYLVDD
jgi:nucleoside-diphosphate-sugar epimerase